MRQTFEIPLDIPDVTIENVTTNRIGHIEITVKSTVEEAPCHRCDKMTTQFYGEDVTLTKPSTAWQKFVATYAVSGLRCPPERLSQCVIVVSINCNNRSLRASLEVK